MFLLVGFRCFVFAWCFCCHSLLILLLHAWRSVEGLTSLIDNFFNLPEQQPTIQTIKHLLHLMSVNTCEYHNHYRHFWSKLTLIYPDHTILCIFHSYTAYGNPMAKQPNIKYSQAHSTWFDSLEAKECYPNSSYWLENCINLVMNLTDSFARWHRTHVFSIQILLIRFILQMTANVCYTHAAKSTESLWQLTDNYIFGNSLGRIVEGAWVNFEYLLINLAKFRKKTILTNSFSFF